MDFLVDAGLRMTARTIERVGCMFDPIEDGYVHVDDPENALM
jgi:hypothetical protein